MCFTFCLLRFCIGVALVPAAVPTQGRTDPKPRQNIGRQKVEHMCVLSFVYLGVASVLHQFCCGSEPGQNLRKTEAQSRKTKGRTHRCFTFCLPRSCSGVASVLLRFRTVAKPRQTKCRTPNRSMSEAKPRHNRGRRHPVCGLP